MRPCADRNLSRRHGWNCFRRPETERRGLPVHAERRLRRHQLPRRVGRAERHQRLTGHSRRRSPRSEPHRDLGRARYSDGARRRLWRVASSRRLAGLSEPELRHLRLACRPRRRCARHRWDSDLDGCELGRSAGDRHGWDHLLRRLDGPRRRVGSEGRSGRHRSRPERDPDRRSERNARSRFVRRLQLPRRMGATRRSELADPGGAGKPVGHRSRPDRARHLSRCATRCFQPFGCLRRQQLLGCLAGSALGHDVRLRCARRSGRRCAGQRRIPDHRRTVQLGSPGGRLRRHELPRGVEALPPAEPELAGRVRRSRDDVRKRAGPQRIRDHGDRGH